MDSRLAGAVFARRSGAAAPLCDDDEEEAVPADDRRPKRSPIVRERRWMDWRAVLAALATP